jgi:hypothetical protein
MFQRNAALDACRLGGPGPLDGKSPARLTEAPTSTGVRAT